MRDGPLADTLKRALFDREAEVLAALRHPNIVTVLDRGLSADSSHYIVMDYVRGRILGEWLREHAALNAKGGDGRQLRFARPSTPPICVGSSACLQTQRQMREKS